MIAFLVLFIINIWIFFKTQEPPKLIEVKEKYRILRENINDEKFSMLKREIPVTGFYSMRGTVGNNTNKGGDISVCLDGDTNHIFHVLLHELAHCTVKEYEHTEQFWNNFTELRNKSVELGIYEMINDKTAFSGDHIQDK